MWRVRRSGPISMTRYLPAIFATIGIHSLEYVRLEGMARGPEAVARGFDAADAWIERRLAQLLGDR
jgi:FMN-dependent NADH-azoreductase